MKRKRADEITIHPPPQPRVLDKSLPVPSGKTATGGNGDRLRPSIDDRIQPTVPSPPQARIRRLGTLPKSSRLGYRKDRQDNKAQKHIIY